MDDRGCLTDFGGHGSEGGPPCETHAGLLNAIAHFVFPLLHGGYFPGLLTAPGHLLLSLLVIGTLLREDRRQAELPLVH